LELLAELPPQRSAEKLLSLASELSRLADAIDVPDAPLGLPAPSSALVSAIIRSRLSPPPEVVAHLRLLDVSGLGALNIAKGLELAGVSRLLLLRGDAPAVGDPCNNEPESVMNTLRSSGVKLRLGLLLSLAKPLEDVMKRVRARADFYFVTRPWWSPALRDVRREAGALGSRVYVYLVVETPRNAHVLAGLPTEEKVREGQVAQAALRLSEAVDGVIISSPGDREALLRSLREVREALG